MLTFTAKVLVEVQSADSIEVWDYEMITPYYDEEAEEWDLNVEELDVGRIFPLDDNGVIIEPIRGIHEFELFFDINNDIIKVINTEVTEEY